MTALPVHERTPLLSAHDAVAVAAALADGFAAGAAKRDRERILPVAEVRALADTGLLAITVPARYGGLGLPASVVAEVVRRISYADPNLGQIPHSHFVYVNQLRLQGTPGQQASIFAEVLGGATIANAQSERGTRHVRDIATTLVPDGEDWLLSGTKFYCTGALFADWLAVLAKRTDRDAGLHVAWIRRDAPGVELADDWDALGQRTTASGTVRLTRVRVPAEQVTPYAATFESPTTYGAYAQLLHAAIDAGIARAALDDAAAFVTSKSRPYPDARVDRHAEDPLVVHAFGELELAVRGSEALLTEAGRAVDAADVRLTDETATAASLAVAAARASTARVCVEVASRLFEVSGTRSALASEALDRHWRNARTHTLHDPVSWKVQHLGRWAVDGTRPPRHGQL